MSAPYDRPTNEPGGCECFDCGVIFIGAEWHTECAVCHAQGTKQVQASGIAPGSCSVMPKDRNGG